MPNRQPRYSKEDHARMGKQMYEQLIRPRVEVDNHGRIVALDVDSGEFEVADDSLTAANRLLERLPDAQIWCERVGYPAVRQIGYWAPSSAS